MKNISLRLLPICMILFSGLLAKGQTPAFRVTYSEPLAVFQFVDHLSSNAPGNPFKQLFDTSRFNDAKYKALLAQYDSLTIDYGYEYTAYPYAQKIGGSTQSLLEKSLIHSTSIRDFTMDALGILPNKDLFTLSAILTAFQPVYLALVYQPYKEQFDGQLRNLRDLTVSGKVDAWFRTGITFYHSSWDSSIPFNLCFYPYPNTSRFSATALYNNSISALPTSLADPKKLLSVTIHEIFHILYDEQSLAFKKQLESWCLSNPSKNSRYAFLLLNEALATAMGNGYVYGQLNGREDTASWYRRKYTNLMAKAIYTLVKTYISSQKPIDQAFLDEYIRLYDNRFPEWLTDIDNVMSDRYVLTDNPANFEAIDRRFPYRSMSQYDNSITGISIEKLKQAPITKLIIISRDNKSGLQLIKEHFGELADWNPEDQKDFSYSVWLKDKTWLIILNNVDNTVTEKVAQLVVKP